MKSDQDAIQDLMERYTDATGIGLYCLNQSLEIQPFGTAGWAFSELDSLDFTEVSLHVQEKYADAAQPTGCFEAFSTKLGLTYLIRDLKTGRGVRRSSWFLISEPILDRKPLENNIPISMPIVSKYRVDQLGKTLDYLCIPFSGSRGAGRLAGCSGAYLSGCMTDLSYPDIQAAGYSLSQSRIHAAAQSIVQKVKSIIQSGNVSALPDLEKTIDFNVIPYHRMAVQDELLAAKDIFIASCTMQFHCVVDAGLPYDRMLRLADQQISKVQRMSQLQDVQAQMKASITAFTYAVHLDHVDRQKASVRFIQSEPMMGRKPLQA